MKGKCSACDKVMTSNVTLRHLQKCPDIQHSGRGLHTFIIRVSCGKFYWMFIRIKANAKLSVLDALLRNTWLECCGHLSGFQMWNERYESFPDESEYESMNIAAKEVLEQGLQFTYDYDYGTMTTLHLKVVSDNKNDTAVMKQPVEILARNLPSTFECVVCKRIADYLFYDDKDMMQFVCDNCVKNYEAEDVYSVEDSPRMGLCAYGLRI